MWELRQLVFLALLFATDGRGKDVQVRLHSGWSGTPYVAEFAEFLWKEISSEASWRYIEQWTPQDTNADVECWPLLHDTASHELSPELKRYLGVVLSLRLMSPRVHMRSQLASHDADHCCWVEVHVGKHIRILSELSEIEAMLKAGNGVDAEHIMEFDFEYPSTTATSNASVAFLYGPIGSRCFGQLHPYLKEAAANGRWRYVFRPVYNADHCRIEAMHSCSRMGTETAIYLGGFGVELAIKSTEYSAVNEPSSPKETAAFAADAELEDVGDLGLQTLQFILSADASLETLVDTIQDYPTYAPRLSTLQIEEDVREAVNAMAQVLPSRQEFVLLNGIPFRLPEFDLIVFLERLQKELRAKNELNKLGLSDTATHQLLKLRAADRTEELEDVRYDILPKDHVIFLNNVEKDPKYRQYYRSLEILLSSFVNSGIVPIRRNLFNCVFFTDMTSPTAVSLVSLIEAVQQQKLPFRIGVVPMTASVCGRNDASPEMIRYFVGLNKLATPRVAFHFWKDVIERQDDVVSIAHSVLESIQSKSASKGNASESFAAVMPDVERYLSSLKDVIAESGLCQLEEFSSFLWLNGRIVELEAATVDRITLYNIQIETQFLQELVYRGEISDEDDDLLSLILSVQPSFAKYATHVSAEPPTVAYVSVHDNYFRREVNFIGQNRETGTKSVTHWIVGDVASEMGLSIVRSGLEFVRSGEGARAQIGLAVTFRDAGALKTLWRKLPPYSEKNSSEIIDFWIELLSVPELRQTLLNDGDSDSKEIDDRVQNLCKTIPCPEISSTDNHCPEEDTVPLVKTLQLSMGLSEELVVVSNGRVIFPCDACEHPSLMHEDRRSGCESFTMQDFVILQTIGEKYQLADGVISILKKELNTTDGAESSRLTSITASILRQYSATDVSEGLTIQKTFKRFDHRVLIESHDPEQHGSTPFILETVLDPTSISAQRFVPVLKFLADVFSPQISVFLHPHTHLDDTPLKQYYRLALPRPLFNKEDVLTSVIFAKAYFHELPETTLLTLNPETPSAWLIEPLQAQLDLDNIRLRDSVKQVLDVEYGLEGLLLTGSCVDTTAKSRKDVYPRGLQLNLGKDPEVASVDTMVMSNLGYFQLKGNPGIWHLSLAQGRSRELYHIDAVMERDKQVHLGSPKSESISLRVVIDSFAGRAMFLKVRKRRGYETEDVLQKKGGESDAESSSLVGRILQWTGLAKDGSSSVHIPAETATENSKWQGCTFPDDPVNIFTIASGHLYERLQKIMILSVLRHTKSCVTFWFIKNYMSPQIKAFLPNFSKQYQFEYRLITYKWPSWLRSQKEKQRKIWAYKILFLDVLFPLHVSKVLFLDSDQIIRTDIRTLYDMDIGGAPLAYTPFCDNNKEMDGFRFWKRGFWEGHLRGKPYHISALYIVDLVRFRQMAAGDYLRVTYDHLSQDPESLSNLDQDLPNYTQHQIPIFSLPQEWLWCETWCGNETKHAAKTIDLCNNPLTKEPKLQQARRIVSEWTELDEEANKITQGTHQSYELPPSRPHQDEASDEHDKLEL